MISVGSFFSQECFDYFLNNFIDFLYNLYILYKFNTIFSSVKKSYWHLDRNCIESFFFFNFTILYWFCHTLTWIHHECTCVCSPSLNLKITLCNMIILTMLILPIYEYNIYFPLVCVVFNFFISFTLFRVQVFYLLG